MLAFCAFLLAVANFAAGQPPVAGDMVRVACARNPNLAFCKQQPQDAAPPPPPPPVVVATVPPPTQPPPPPPAAEDPTNWDAICRQYQEHFFHYCLNIDQQTDAELKQVLQEHCPTYYKQCPEYVKRGAADSAKKGPLFPDIPSTTQPPLEKCTYNCTAPHCTPKCICDYYAIDQGMDQRCHEQGGGLPLLSNNCQMFFEGCEEYGYKLDPKRHKEGIANHARQSGLPPPNDEDPHNRNHHAQFFRSPDSVHTDWLHGQFGAGQDWGVPALGIGGTAAKTSVSFPSLGDFGDIDNPNGPIRRRRRSILTRYLRNLRL